MQAHDSQQQGAAFEHHFGALMDRLLGEIGFEVLQDRSQPAGAQHGKDLQIRWRDAAGSEVFWHFECKSHKKDPLPAREVADKLIDVMRSGHDIDAWCLVLAGVEPGAWIDETIAWLKKNVTLPFEIVVLSPEQNYIKQIFSCEPDLYERQYGKEPSQPLTDDGRKMALARLRALLDSTTRVARERRARAWTVVAPARVATEDNAEMAVAYLRGYGATTPWQAVSNGWAISRQKSTGPIIERISSAAPGFDYAWLVAAGGEGKSTAMRQIAWQIADAYPHCLVLWTEPALQEEAVDIPVELIEAFGDGTDVLLCIDGSRGLIGADRLRASTERLAQTRKRVFMLLADRGTEWHKSALRTSLRRGMSNKERRMGLKPLDEEEANSLVGKLMDHELLRADQAAEATATLRARPALDDSVSWLLPTVMQLTDPEERGFEGILASVVGQLHTQPDDRPLLLLLAASIAQAAGHPLPYDLAERLVGGSRALTTSLEILTAELEAAFPGSSAVRELEDPEKRLITHHQVVAEGFVEVAATNSDFRPRLLDACDAVPATVAEEVDPELMIPRPRLHFLLASLTFLEGFSPSQHEAVERFLQAIFALDPRQFLALARLADRRTDWLRDELESDHANGARITWLEAKARHTYREALRLAQEILGGDAPRPRPYAHRELAQQEKIVMHGWGVLEDLIGQHTRDLPTLKRSTLLFLLTFFSRGKHTLPLPLIHAGELHRAAQAIAACRPMASSNRDLTQIRNQGKMLADLGQPALDPEDGALDGLLADLVLNFLLDDWAEITIYDRRKEHLGALRTILEDGAREQPNHQQIDQALKAIALMLDEES